MTSIVKAYPTRESPPSPTNAPVVPANAGNPLSLWERVRVRVAPAWCTGGSRTARRSRHLKRTAQPTTTPHCPIAAQPLHWSHTSSPRQAPSFQRRLESSVRDSGAHTGRRSGRVVSDVPRARPRHSSEGWNPACATVERTRGEGAEGRVRRSPRIPPSFQRRLESSVRDSGAHTGRRGGRVVSEVPVSAETSHPWVLPPQSTTTAHCPIATPTPSPSFPCRREPRIPCPLSGCRGGSRTARRSRHPKRTAQPTTTAHCPIDAPTLTLVTCAVPTNPSLLP